MNKLYKIALAIVMAAFLVSCTKDNSTTKQADPSVTIIANYEQPLLVNGDGTKVSISESGSKFNLFWEGTENMSVANSSEANTIKDDFTTTDSGTSTATFTGASGLPAPKEGYSAETINYIGVVSSFASATASLVRGAIRVEQVYDPTAPTSIAKNAFLVARADNCTIGSLTTLNFKTMNAFMKFSLIKGDPAVGATHTYPKMYVKNIVIESVNEEYISGRFGISKTAADWYNSYSEEVDAHCSKTVTLDCTSGNTTKGVELGGVAKDFYIAIASKTYAEGLKVTINVQNEDGDLGKMEGYYKKNTSLVVARNTMIRISEFEVRPEDVASDIICWSENWNGGEAGQTPETYLSSLGHTGTVVYNDEPITYSQSTDNTKLYAETVAGGSSPELMLRKKESSTNGIWTISGIPTAGATTLSLTYKCNNDKPVVTCSTAGTTVSGDKKNYTISTGGATTITLVFTNSTSSNSRIDDIVLKVID